MIYSHLFYVNVVIILSVYIVEVKEMPLIKRIEAYCIICHRRHMECNCSNQIKLYGIEAVKKYDKEIKSGKRYWGYQQYYQQILGLQKNTKVGIE